MFNGILNEIPEVYIKNYKSNSTSFLIVNLDELYEKHLMINNPHRISYFQIILFGEGEGSIAIDSKRYNYEPKSLLALSKGRVEVSKFSKSTGYAILFSEEFLNKSMEDVGWINSLKLFDISCDPLITNLTDKEYINLLIYFKKLMKESMAVDDFAKDDIILNLLKTFILIAERIKRRRVSSESKVVIDPFYINEFKKKLEENFYNAKSVQQYAKLLNITTKKLNRIAVDSLGKPAKYVIEERVLLEIKRLLIHTDKSIKEISILLGFSEPTNFNKFFKKFVGETPAHFRLSNKNRIVS